MKIKIKRGLQSNITSAELDSGELAFTTDTKRLYIGNDAEKILLADGLNFISELDDLLDVNSSSPSPDQILGYDGTAWIPVENSGGSSVNYIEKGSAYTAVKDDYIFADSSGGAFQITLPGSPSMGDTVSILDATGSFDSENVTIGRNGNNIMGLGDDYILDVVNSETIFKYYNSTYGWRVI